MMRPVLVRRTLDGCHLNGWTGGDLMSGDLVEGAKRVVADLGAGSDDIR